jgi:hypothetical protein
VLPHEGKPAIHKELEAVIILLGLLKFWRISNIFQLKTSHNKYISIYKKFWEELIVYLLLIRHAPHWEPKEMEVGQRHRQQDGLISLLT